MFHVLNISKIYRMGEVDMHALRAVDIDFYAAELVELLRASGRGGGLFGRPFADVAKFGC